MWFILLLNYFSDLRVVGVLVNTYMIAFTWLMFLRRDHPFTLFEFVSLSKNDIIIK